MKMVGQPSHLLFCPLAYQRLFLHNTLPVGQLMEKSVGMGRGGVGKPLAGLFFLWQRVGEPKLVLKPGLDSPKNN